MKNKKNIIIGTIIAVVVIIGLYIGGSYNSFVTKNEAIDSQWAQVETQYQRRFDLIPNLVESVKGIMKQEQTVFTAIAEARTRYAGSATVDDKVKNAQNLDGALARLLVIVENYPQLNSSQTVQSLMAELAGTENRVSFERKRFNDMVQTYNVTTKRFPGSIVASLFGFHERAYFAAVAGSENAPKVSF